MKLKKYLTKAYAGLCLLSATVVANAGTGNGIIPISSADETGSTNKDFAQTVLKIFTTDIIPVLEVVGAVGILWISLSALWNGLKEAQELKKWDPLKNAIIKAVLVIVIGGAILYLLQTVQSNGAGLITN